MQNDKLNQYFETFSSDYSDALSSNKMYFESLLNKFYSKESTDLVIYHPEKAPSSKVYPYAFLDKNDDLIPVTHYEDLTKTHKINSDITLIKMHAGLGSSVKRRDYLKDKTGRSKLGSKGTDLFINDKSLAVLQMRQVEILNESAWCEKVYLQNLVNEETKVEVIKSIPKNNFLKPEITQLKMPTLNSDNEITWERKAPGGHAYLGFDLMLDIKNNPITNPEIIAIGNGEDLNSTPDHKILSWMQELNIPICMITTTKTSNDKKGGQIAVVKADTPYLTIIEKAQAEKANQLEYFSEIGLRDQDNISLFNTNIVLLNKHILSKLFEGHLSQMSEREFGDLIAPDLIKNQKEQDGKTFIQLEGAIASVMLNLDKYFRENHQKPLIQFLNLDPVSREQFFIPIKKMKDFEKIQEKYVYNNETGRLDLKTIGMK